MYAIQESAKKINGVELQTFWRTIKNAKTDIEIEAGTTGFKGGCCRDKGARAFLSLDCNQGDFFFEPQKDEDGRVVGITIACCGDDQPPRPPGEVFSCSFLFDNEKEEHPMRDFSIDIIWAKIQVAMWQSQTACRPLPLNRQKEMKNLWLNSPL